MYFGGVEGRRLYGSGAIRYGKGTRSSPISVTEGLLKRGIMI
jgi:hypothetical protein